MLEKEKKAEKENVTSEFLWITSEVFFLRGQFLIYDNSVIIYF